MKKKAAFLKKQLLRKCNYCVVDVVTLTKCDKVASPKIKVDQKKTKKMQKGKTLFKKKKKTS